MQQRTHSDAQKHHVWHLLFLAFPLILANITTPLLGLVDTAILGHMDATHYLAGASIGTLILTQLYWICGFLKMSITGLSAQAGRGNLDVKEQQRRTKVLVQGVTFGLFLGLLFILLQTPILNAGLYFAQSSELLKESTEAYFSVRIWGAPAALANMALVGWLIGQQKTKSVLMLQVAVNFINIIFSLLFVFVFDWGVKGVAGATVVAEFSLLVFSLALSKRLINMSLFESAWLKWIALKPLLSLNSDILLRNLALQLTLAFITFKGASMGAQIAATNAILMQFFALIALGLDGVANAVEALVGEEKGRKNIKALNHHVKVGLLWSSLFSVLYAFIFWQFGVQIIQTLTDQPVLQKEASNYLGLMILLPMVAHWCFLFDGVFVGLSKGKAMRDSMILSTVFGFFMIWWFVMDLGNTGLWIALLSFLAFRGAILGSWFVFLAKKPNLRIF
ncbi:MATE family efflux transporter [Glaciecola sp. MF2-115]|uniref:MATE family efflux transporter n=1 Tax=Glaciecola sp. MF2-115 TaxID=3384827 RepID=UPI0039A310C8